jgi:hypothetical protein
MKTKACITIFFLFLAAHCLIGMIEEESIILLKENFSLARLKKPYDYLKNPHATFFSQLATIKVKDLFTDEVEGIKGLLNYSKISLPDKIDKKEAKIILHPDKHKYHEASLINIFRDTILKNIDTIFQEKKLIIKALNKNNFKLLFTALFNKEYIQEVIIYLEENLSNHTDYAPLIEEIISCLVTGQKISDLILSEFKNSNKKNYCLEHFLSLLQEHNNDPKKNICEEKSLLEQYFFANNKINDKYTFAEKTLLETIYNVFPNEMLYKDKLMSFQDYQNFLSSEKNNLAPWYKTNEKQLYFIH